MEEVITTAPSTEPIVVESANTASENTAGLSQVVETPTVVDQATPMDSNTTYDNLPKVDIDPNKSAVQNLVSNAINIDRENKLDQYAGTAMNKFLTHDYDYDKNEAGTYWVAGAINDTKTQMSFLQSIINEEMYDEMDLQKYYYDTNLATARAYAAQKNKEVAYGFYRAAQERALAEGELTGWYMPAEGRYMLGQYNIAKEKINNSEATPEEITKANHVIKTTEEWFAANQITSQGIKCLSMMNYEENVRHNNVMNELQRQSIAAQKAGLDLQLREYKFQLEEKELATGVNYTKALGLDNDNTIGHNLSDYKGLQALSGYDSVTQMLDYNPDAYASVLTVRGLEYIKSVLGDDYGRINQKYEATIGDTGLSKSITDNGNILDESYLNKQVYEIDATEKLSSLGNDKHVYTFTHTENGQPVTKAYYKDNSGIFHQITGDVRLKGGSILSDKVINFSPSEIIKDGNTIRVGAKQMYSKMEGSVSQNSDAYKGMSNKQKETVKQKEAEGYKIKRGYKSTQGIDADIVMEDDQGNLIEVSNIQGKAQSISQGQIKALNYDDTIESNSAEYSSTIEIGTMPEYRWGELNGQYTKNARIILAVDANNNTHYYVESYYSNGSYKYNKVDAQTVAQYVENLSTVEASISDYINGVSTVTGKNSETIIQEQSGSKANEPIKNYSESPVISSPANSYSETKNSSPLNNSEANYEKVDKVEINNGPQVLEDINKDPEKEKNKTINDVKLT